MADSDPPVPRRPGARGGARPGAGRRPGDGYRWGEPTRVMRIPASRINAVRDFLERPHGLLRPAEQPTVVRLPLFSHKIAAGFPSQADDYIEARIDLNEHLVRNEEATFMLRVQGDSMIGAGIHDGGLLVIDRAVDPVDGRIVIAVLDGELTVKRLSRRDGRVRLLPENPAYAPIEVGDEQDLVIWGVVTSVIHEL